MVMMARRVLVRLEDVACLDNLARAFWLAARGKRSLPVVRAFEERLDRELSALGQAIRNSDVQIGRMRSFTIHDPKRRVIHAPVFRERVLHHALMAHVGPVIERSLVADTFACRIGKGTLAAVHRAQAHSARFRWFAKLDMRSYFASIDHQVLRGQIRRRIKGASVLALLDRVVAGYEFTAGDDRASDRPRGLPIGALTSQHFANLYLSSLDRLLLEGQRVAMVRYMDDVVIWCQDRQAARQAGKAAVDHARESLRLTVKPSWQIAPCDAGVPFLGFRVFGNRLELSTRRKRRYRQARRRWENAFANGFIGARALQAGYASALAVTAHANAAPWRRRELKERGCIDV